MSASVGVRSVSVNVSVNVCVCPPLDKGFRPTNPLVTFTTVQFHSRGVRLDTST